MTGWANDLHYEMLVTLWAEGVSCSAIAKSINAAFPDARYSRNAVIGKVHRTGLPPRSVAVRAVNNWAARQQVGARPKPKPKARPLIAGGAVYHHPEPRPAREPIPDRPEVAGTETLLSVRDDQCKWPIGDPEQPTFRLCGCPSVEGKPYCASHAQVAYLPHDPKKARTANELARSLRRWIAA